MCRWISDSRSAELLFCVGNYLSEVSRSELQTISHVKHSRFSIDLINRVPQSNQITAGGFSSMANGVFSQFRLVGPKQQPTLFFQTFEYYRVELRSSFHGVVYVFLPKKFSHSYTTEFSSGDPVRSSHGVKVF